MTTNGKDQCQNCKFARRDMQSTEWQCFRYPPQLFMVQIPPRIAGQAPQATFFSRPGLVQPHLWCGEHQRFKPEFAFPQEIINSDPVEK